MVSGHRAWLGLGAMENDDEQVQAHITLGHSDITMRPIGVGCMTMS